jgi:hypothetical protein
MGWPHEIDNGQNVLSLNCVEGVPLWCGCAQLGGVLPVVIVVVLT